MWYPICNKTHLISFLYNHYDILQVTLPTPTHHFYTIITIYYRWHFPLPLILSIQSLRYTTGDTSHSHSSFLYNHYDILQETLPTPTHHFYTIITIYYRRHFPLPLIISTQLLRYTTGDTSHSHSSFLYNHYYILQETLPNPTHHFYTIITIYYRRHFPLPLIISIQSLRYTTGDTSHSHSSFLHNYYDILQVTLPTPTHHFYTIITIYYRWHFPLPIIISIQSLRYTTGDTSHSHSSFLHNYYDILQVTLPTPTHPFYTIITIYYRWHFPLPLIISTQLLRYRNDEWEWEVSPVVYRNDCIEMMIGSGKCHL